MPGLIYGQIAPINLLIEGTAMHIAMLAAQESPGCPPEYVGTPVRIAILLNGIEFPAGACRVTVNNSSTGFIWPAAP